jgi:hypothetical protein
MEISTELKICCRQIVVFKIPFRVDEVLRQFDDDITNNMQF